ncbi:hypothetical protein HOY80DRAFT_970289 [Tuber brumale]|nr:hypothetical protein HOY80DRAFT_970289 [Tuber brumale]
MILASALVAGCLVLRHPVQYQYLEISLGDCGSRLFIDTSANTSILFSPHPPGAYPVLRGAPMFRKDTETRDKQHTYEHQYHKRVQVQY